MEHNKKIVAHFSVGMNYGGIETLLMNIFREINKDKINFIFICCKSEKKFDYEDEIMNLGGKIIKIESPKKNLLKHIFELYKTFKNLNKTIDIVHSHSMFHSGLVVTIAYLSGIKKRISHSHSTISPAFKNTLSKQIMRLLINIFSTKKLASSNIAGEFLFGKKSKFIFFPNAINLDKFTQVPANNNYKNQLKNNLQITNNEIIIGTIGRLVKQKNQLFLIEIANKLSKIKYNYKILIIGDGPLKKVLKQRIQKLQLEKNIILMGNRNDVPKLLRMFDIFVLPSINEGLGISGIEAQASGLNCIFSDKVPKEIDMNLGLVNFLKVNNSEFWVKKIIEIVNNKKNVDKEEIIEKINGKGFNIKDLNLLYKIYGL